MERVSDVLKAIDDRLRRNPNIKNMLEIMSRFKGKEVREMLKALSPSVQQDRLLTQAEVRECLRVSSSAIQNMVAQGRLKAYTSGESHIRKYWL